MSGERRIVAFCCRECAYAAADTSANARTALPPSVRLVLVPCTGRVGPLHLLRALADGADGVMVAGCLLGQCHYREGNFNAVDRVAFVRRLLESVGVEPERCRMFTMSAGEPPRFVAAVREMDRVIAALHGVDVAAVGLADYGKPGNYFERQIGRWSKQYPVSYTHLTLPTIYSV